MKPWIVALVSLGLNGVVGTAVAQIPFIQYEESTGHRLIDPRGDRPAGINNPLPYYCPPSVPAVHDQAREADYYYWEENSGWVFHHRVIRERDSEGSVQYESILGSDVQSPTRQRTFLYSPQNKLTGMATYLNGESQRSSALEEYVREVDPANGLVINERRKTTSHGSEHEFIRHVEPAFDREGQLVQLNSYSRFDTVSYEPVQYSFEYDGSILKSMIQYSFEKETGRFNPAFRYDQFGFVEQYPISYRTSAFDTGGWRVLQKDTAYATGVYERYFRTVWLDEGNKQVTCRLTYDEKGNLIRMEQTGLNDETISDIQLNITYAPGGQEPLEVISSYLDSSGIEQPSIKVIYRNLSSEETTGTVLYPNPARSFVQWRSGKTSSDACNYQITDPMGKSIRKGTAQKQPSGNFLLNIEDLPVGNYLLQLNDSSRSDALLFSVIR